VAGGATPPALDEAERYVPEDVEEVAPESVNQVHADRGFPLPGRVVNRLQVDGPQARVGPPSVTGGRDANGRRVNIKPALPEGAWRATRIRTVQPARDRLTRSNNGEGSGGPARHA
jgi:hypothetical protein